MYLNFTDSETGTNNFYHSKLINKRNLTEEQSIEKPEYRFFDDAGIFKFSITVLKTVACGTMQII